MIHVAPAEDAHEVVAHLGRQRLRLSEDDPQELLGILGEKLDLLDRAGLLARQAHRLGYLDQRIDGPDVFALHKIGLEQCVVDAGTVGLCASPGSEFLGQTAVVGVRALAVRQALLGHEPTHTRLTGGTVYVIHPPEVPLPPAPLEGGANW